MTSKRPNVDDRGKIVDKKPDPQGRIFLQNSQIYSLELNNVFKPVAGKNKPQFQLVKLSLDTRPRIYANFGIMNINMDGRELLLLFGGDSNPIRYTLLFDLYKREICKCNIYTGDEDRMLTNFVWNGEQSLIFGETRLHIYDR